MSKKKPTTDPKSAKPKAADKIRLEELTADLKRTRADFENYRKRVETEKQQARESGKISAVMQLLPVIDNIERAVAHRPEDLRQHKWAEGVMTLPGQLVKQLEKLDVKRIPAKPGDEFNPDLHEAVQFDENSEGDKEIIQDELQTGYTLDGTVIRPAMVKVSRQ